MSEDTAEYLIVERGKVSLETSVAANAHVEAKEQNANAEHNTFFKYFFMRKYPFLIVIF